ncbi:MAG TPA: hypothetical protein VEI46_10280, partial [Thermodesulfovibrionales bacterium]|nr:hypothetical protein [Thermodesulfovibrionales bacterium]
MKLRTKMLLMAAFFALVLPLVFIGTAGAFYLPDGSKPDGSGGFANPQDGMCVIGVANDGTMLIDTSITNYQDCNAYTQSADAIVSLSGMTSSAACTNPTNAGNVAVNGKNYKYAFATPTCVKGGNPISLAFLDPTAAMCTSLGGTTGTTSVCKAYGWVRMKFKSNGSPAFTSVTPVPGSSILVTTKGTSSSDLGFCYASMRMQGNGYNASTTCPSYHNTASLAGGPNGGEWPACQSSTSGCQTQASYQAGLGWSWDSTNSRCLYAQSQIGALNAQLNDMTGVAATVPLCAGGTGSATAGTCVNLSGYTMQGDCIAHGGSWQNWFATGQATDGNTTTAANTTVTSATPGYSSLPANAQIVVLDATTAVKNGGGYYYGNGVGGPCLACHSDQSRSTMGRYKVGVMETRHKHAGYTANSSQPWYSSFNDATDTVWGVDGVTCTVCHGVARPGQDDAIQIVPAGIVGPPAAGSAKGTGTHNNTEMGSHAN